MDKLRYYVELFNKNDEQTYKNSIDNDAALAWLADEIPLLECPDEDIERTYYFRWWTYRKHLRHTEDGWVITEFLPKVPWSGKHNVINAAAGHHICEGRWLKNGNAYLGDYIKFLIDTPDSSHQYSTWLVSAAVELARVSGDFELCIGLLPKLCRYYERWEELHGLDCGMFWSVDNYDAMEFSISGTTPEGRALRGIRPTLNSYMCADALAIAELACRAGNKLVERKYMEKHLHMKRCINDYLWNNGFYRALHSRGAGEICADALRGTDSPRELIGYIPWMFGIPEAGREDVFDLLDDESVFLTRYGISTADRTDARYLYEVAHECLWNGYVWPFATSQTLAALNNVIRYYGGRERYASLFVKLLSQYAASHTRISDGGVVLPWIDEVRHPERDEWSSRELLREWGWREDKGGYERGKDYNHSTFCDLVISGLLGVNTDGEELSADPIIPDSWDYFKLSHLNFRGKTYTVLFDRTGERYGHGKGLRIIEHK